jgi:hypothetical protein
MDPGLLKFLLLWSYYMKAIPSKGFILCGSGRYRLCGVADI